MHPPIVESYKLHSLWLSMREEQATSKHVRIRIQLSNDSEN
jgi:hypothetical protein